MTSREDLGRLAYAAYCDMVGRPYAWDTLDDRKRAGWVHVFTTIRDRLMYGDGHGYRPDEAARSAAWEESAMGLINKSNAHGGSGPPTITGTDVESLYLSEKAAGNSDIRWDGDSPAPDAAEPEPELEQVTERPVRASTRGGRRR